MNQTFVNTWYPATVAPIRRILISRYLPLFIVAGLIFCFHLVDIFYIKTMYVDDHHRLILGLENRIHETIYLRNKLRAYVNVPLYKLLSYGPMYARFAEVVFFYIPLSLSFYFLLRRFAGLSKVEAIAAAVIPCLLPGQWMLPNFIDGSYTIHGLLAFNVALYTSLHYLTSHDGIKAGGLILVALLFGASLEMMDHAVFLVPVAIASMLPFCLRKNRKSFATMAAIFLALGVAKGIQAFYFPTMSVSTTIEPSMAIFIQRFTVFMHTVVPFSHSISGEPFSYKTLFFVVVLMSSIGFVLGDWRDRYLLLIAFTLAFSSSILFLTLTKYFSPRYAHIAGFGVNLLLVHSLFIICRRALGHGRKLQLASAFLFASLIVYGGSIRTSNLIERHRGLNETHNGIANELKYHGFPEGAQVVVIDGGRIPTGGWWHYGRGYIKYVTGRPDLNGTIGWQRFFYDPFKPGSEGFIPEYQMSGLDIGKNTFFFELKACYPDKPCTFWQYEYVLRYMDPAWELLKFNQYTGEHTVVLSGEGKESFYEQITTQNILIENILFAQ